MMAVHRVEKCIKNYTSYHVPYKTAALHHYRLEQKWPNDWIIDKTAYKYSSHLIDKIIKLKKNMREI